MSIETYLSRLKSDLEPLGFECHPFKVEWYNQQVQPSFSLKYPPNTLAVLLVSTPSMFEKTLVPFFIEKDCTSGKDPLDVCISEHFEKVIKSTFPDTNVDILYDYELDHRRRPKILVQTAGHVSGAAYYYQRKSLTKDPWDAKKKIFGVSIHPKYGGWFAFRGAFVFKDIEVDDLEPPFVEDPVPANDDRIELLRRFNENWRDGSYRDIICATEKYSDEQRLYFNTAPKDRQEVVKSLRTKFMADHNQSA